jgi:hypothetical protein
MIPSKTHAVIDYMVAVLLLAAPYIFEFANGGPAQIVPMVLGAGIILYSLLTRYELSIAKLIPYRAHLVLDVLGGLVLLASPWIFGFTDEIWWPHVVVGIAELGVVAMSWGGSEVDDRLRA